MNVRFSSILQNVAWLQYGQELSCHVIFQRQRHIAEYGLPFGLAFSCLVLVGLAFSDLALEAMQRAVAESSIGNFDIDRITADDFDADDFAADRKAVVSRGEGKLLAVLMTERPAFRVEAGK